MSSRAEVLEAWRKLVARLHGRKANYQFCFGSPAGKEVAKDLARFCRASETTMHPTQDARVHAMLEGRRQVWLRIHQHMNYSPEELAAVYRAAVLDTGDNNG